MSSEAVESITVRLAGLELTITARPITSGPSVSYSVSAEAPRVQFEVDHRLQDSAIAASTARACEALNIPFLGHLAPRLRDSPVGAEWTAQARIGRAFRAGVVARRQLAGEIQSGASPSSPQRNTVYVVLRDRTGGRPFWGHQYHLFIAAVQDHSQRGFHQNAVCHAFPSQAEAEAYVAGAGEPWPQRKEE